MKRAIAILLAMMLGVLCSEALGEDLQLATPTDLFAEEVAEGICAVPEDTAAAEEAEEQEVPEATEAAEIPAAAEALAEADVRDGLMLKEAVLLSAPDGDVLAALPAGTTLAVLQVGEGWCLVRVQDGQTGYVLTDAVALYNEKPAEEENIRAIFVTSNTANMITLKEGMTVILSAQLIGFENDEYTLQWQYSPDGGVTAIDIAGANGLQYGYFLNRDNMNYLYRVVVSYGTDAATEQ